MDTPTAVAIGISSLSFGAYGLACFLDPRMVGEFVRYRAASFRVATGALQIAASAGLILGIRYRPLLLLSASGLAAMMLVAVVVRVRIRDPIPAALPALGYCVLNGFIAWRALRPG